MLTPTPPANTSQKPWLLWTGRVLSALPILMLAFSGALAFVRPPALVAGMAKFGYPESVLFLLGVLEVGSALLYAIPRTAVLGAILMTGYLGGAIATHVRIGDPGWPTALILGIMVWGGLYLRDERIRVLLPLRRP